MKAHLLSVALLDADAAREKAISSEMGKKCLVLLGHQHRCSRAEQIWLADMKCYTKHVHSLAISCATLLVVRERATLKRTAFKGRIKDAHTNDIYSWSVRCQDSGVSGETRLTVVHGIHEVLDTPVVSGVSENPPCSGTFRK